MEKIEDYYVYIIKDKNNYITSRKWCLVNLPKNTNTRIYHFAEFIKVQHFNLYFHKSIKEYFFAFLLLGLK